MRRRSYLCEVIQVLLSAAVIVLTVVLFFRADQLSVLFPVVFGLAAVLSLFFISLAAVDGFLPKIQEK